MDDPPPPPPPILLQTILPAPRNKGWSGVGAEGKMDKSLCFFRLAQDVLHGWGGSLCFATQHEIVLHEGRGGVRQGSARARRSRILISIHEVSMVFIDFHRFLWICIYFHRFQMILINFNGFALILIDVHNSSAVFNDFKGFHRFSALFTDFQIFFIFA